jgi:hypothetical protein
LDSGKGIEQSWDQCDGGEVEEIRDVYQCDYEWRWSCSRGEKKSGAYMERRESVRRGQCGSREDMWAPSMLAMVLRKSLSFGPRVEHKQCSISMCLSELF